jgi:hypothetical protein
MAKRREFVLAQIKADEEARLAEQQRQSEPSSSRQTPSPQEGQTDAPRHPEPVGGPELQTPNPACPGVACDAGNARLRTPISHLRNPKPLLRSQRGPINSGSFPYFDMNFERRPTPSANPNQPRPPSPRVSPEIFPKNVNNSNHPPAPQAPPPEPAPQARDRMSREAATRIRLTGDPCTSDALVVL